MKDFLFAVFHEYFLTCGRRSYEDPPPSRFQLRLLATLELFVFLSTRAVSVMAENPTVSRSFFIISRCGLVAFLLGVFGKWLSRR